MPTYQARPFAIGDIGAGGLVYYNRSIGEPNLNYDSHLLLRASTNDSLLMDSSSLGMTVTSAGSTPIAWSSDKLFV